MQFAADSAECLAVNPNLRCNRTQVGLPDFLEQGLAIVLSQQRG